MTMVIPASPALMQWFTTKQLFIGTMTVFTIGSIIGAAAPTFSILLIGRLLQAIGAGLILPLMFSVVLLIYPPYKRGKIMGIVGLIIMFAPAIAPTIAGVVIDYLGWRFLLILVIPFTVFSILFAYKYMMNVSEITKPKIDKLSIILSTVGFSAIIYGFSAVGESEAGFLTLAVLTPLIIGATSIILFAIRQFKIEEPLMDLRVFKLPMFSHGVVMFLIIVMTMFIAEVILPLFMQGPMRLSATTAGLVLLPGSILSAVISPFMGASLDKVGPRVMMIPGTIGLAGTMFLFSRLTAETPPWLIIVVFALSMLFLAATMMPAETNGLNQLPKRLYPHGTAVMSTIQPLSGALGVAVFTSILNSRQKSYLNSVANPMSQESITQAMVVGVEFVYFILFFITIITVILSFIVYRARPLDEDDPYQ